MFTNSLVPLDVLAATQPRKYSRIISELSDAQNEALGRLRVRYHACDIRTGAAPAWDLDDDTLWVSITQPRTGRTDYFALYPDGRAETL